MLVYEVIPGEPRGRITSRRAKMLVYEVIPGEPRGNLTSRRAEMLVHEVVLGGPPGHYLRPRVPSSPGRTTGTLSPSPCPELHGGPKTHPNEAIPIEPQNRKNVEFNTDYATCSIENFGLIRYNGKDRFSPRLNEFENCKGVFVMRINLNKNWDFFFDNEKSDKVVVSIPHTVKETPFNAFSEEIYQTVCRYEKQVAIPKEAAGKRLILHVDGAAHRATLIVNGKEMYTHKCGYTAFDVDITEAVGVNGTNSEAAGTAFISIVLDTRESLDQPPFGNVIDYMTYGGIYRDVWLDIKPQVYIKSTYHHYIETGSEVVNSGDDSSSTDEKNRKIAEDNVLESKIVIGSAPEMVDITKVNITQIIKDSSQKEIARLSMCAAVRDGLEGKEVNLKMPIQVINKWDVDNPNLYTIETTVSGVDDNLAGADGNPTDSDSDTYSVTMGFRNVEWRSDGFYLNGKKVKLRGINRHQSYAYVGYAMPGSVQREDVLILKNELGMNAVRTSHYPQSHDFIEECDRQGVLVFTEIPGWQHIGEDEWKNQAVKNTEDMIIQYRNHPSIVLWGVRINESMDDDELYKRTNKVAKDLAPGIYTGGVRFIKKSSLLEDVYTYNDFIHNGKNKGASEKHEITPDMKKGYLVSEYCGHMFPTKPYDDETHRIDHALRHATVLNEIYKQDDIAGSFGWCMFDYNTHKDFGSGDRVCYHGLMDMFRNAKPAAAVYKSQSESEPVLEVLSDMNIGEYPACDLRKIVVLTNMDSVKLYKNGLFVKEFFPDEAKYSDMPHPPVFVDDFVGELLVTQEGFSKRKSDNTKKVLKAIQENGMNTLPVSAYFRMGMLMLFGKMTIEKGYALYSKYVSGWGDKVREYEFVGIKDGKEAIRVKRYPSNSIHLDVRCLRTELAESGGYDAEPVRIRVLNQNGAVETYVNEEVYLETSGSIEIVGPKVATLRGGMGGTYIRTTGTGEGSLTMKFREEEKTINFTIR